MEAVKITAEKTNSNCKNSNRKNEQQLEKKQLTAVKTADGKKLQLEKQQCENFLPAVKIAAA